MTVPVTRAVALDGPSGSGKSTVARAVARHLGWRYVDTGATYRAATLVVLRAGLAPRDSSSAEVAAAVVAAVARDAITLSVDPDLPGVRIDGEDVSEAIRSPQVTSSVSAVSAVPAVRTAVVAFQQRLIGAGGCVVEGRDIASVVLPHAEVKVFLDAAVEVRAGRRAADTHAGVVAAPGTTLTEAVEHDLARRDRLDSTRAASPLRAAPDAVHLDTSQMSLADVVEAVLALAARAGFDPAGPTGAVEGIR